MAFKSVSNSLLTPKACVAMVAFLLASGGLSLRAQTVFSDNFNSYTAGQALPLGSTHSWANESTANFTSETVTQDTGNTFGEGTSNNYLTLTGDGTNASVAYVLLSNNFSTSTLTGSVTYSFDQTGAFTG